MTTQQAPQSGTTDTNPSAAGTTPPTNDQPTTGGDAPPAATDTTGTDAPPAWDGEFDPERAKRTIENQRRAESELKRKLAEQQAKLDEIEREKMTEAEKAKADADRFKAEAEAARAEAFNARFEAAAVAAGIPPERIAAARAVAGEVATTDDSGNMSVDTSVFDRLKAEHGYLFGQQAAPQPHVSFGAAASQGQGGTGAGLTAEQLAAATRLKMTPDEYVKYAARTPR